MLPPERWRRLYLAHQSARSSLTRWTWRYPVWWREPFTKRLKQLASKLPAFFYDAQAAVPNRQPSRSTGCIRLVTLAVVMAIL